MFHLRAEDIVETHMLRGAAYFMNLSRKASSSNSVPSGRTAARLSSRASLRITSLNLSPGRRWDFSLSSIQRSSQIHLGPCSSIGFS